MFWMTVGALCTCGVAWACTRSVCALPAPTAIAVLSLAFLLPWASAWAMTID